MKGLVLHQLNISPLVTWEPHLLFETYFPSVTWEKTVYIGMRTQGRTIWYKGLERGDHKESETWRGKASWLRGSQACHRALGHTWPPPYSSLWGGQYSGWVDSCREVGKQEGSECKRRHLDSAEKSASHLLFLTDTREDCISLCPSFWMGPYD